MPVEAVTHSKSKVDKAGRFVREFDRSFRRDRDAAWRDHDIGNLNRAIDVLDEFRAAHARPLARVNAGLRYYVKKVGMAQPDVTQRLKRFSTIVHKLDREPTMQLSKMEDIAGVRAVVMTERQVRDIRECLEKAARWKIRRVRDYISHPKADGYRAIHIVTERDGCYVEIQLRTPWQDTWAQSVEQDTRRLRSGLKFGTGPDDLREYYRLVSQLFAMREQGQEPDQGFMEDLAKLFAATRSYFPENGT